MAFASDRDFAPVVARVTSRTGDGGIDVEATRAAPGLEAQVARILSLDVDGTMFADVVAHDREVALALEERPGFRPVVFPSPYDAAVWGVLAQRVPMTFAATLKARLCEATGTVARGFGESFVVAPHPLRLLAALVLYRGAGIADALPLEEPRLLTALGARPGVRGLDEVRSRAAGWAPFRMWVSVLLVSRLAGTPQWSATSQRPRGTRSAPSRSRAAT